MEIKNIIIHELKKESTENQGEAVLSKTTLEINDKTSELLEALDNLFTNGGSAFSHGVFDLDEGRQFPSSFFEYIQDPSAESMVEFSKKMMYLLRDMVSSSAAKGGYFVFADYLSERGDFFSIYFLRNTTAFNFTKESENPSFEIESVEHLDISKLAMACQIDIQKYYTGDGNFLRFTKNPRLQDVSNYFYDWIAVDEELLLSTKVYTQELLDMTNYMDRPINEDTGEFMERDEFKQKVYDCTMENAQKSVNLKELGQKLYPEKDTYFQEYAKQNNYRIDVDFKPDTKTMKKFHRVETSSDNIKLGFEIEDINKKVFFDPDEHGKIIINSETLVNKIRDYLDMAEGEKF